MALVQRRVLVAVRVGGDVADHVGQPQPQQARQDLVERERHQQQLDEQAEELASRNQRQGRSDGPERGGTQADGRLPAAVHPASPLRVGVQRGRPVERRHPRRPVRLGDGLQYILHRPVEQEQVQHAAQGVPRRDAPEHFAQAEVGHDQRQVPGPGGVGAERPPAGSKKAALLNAQACPQSSPDWANAATGRRAARQPLICA